MVEPKIVGYRVRLYDFNGTIQLRVETFDGADAKEKALAYARTHANPTNENIAYVYALTLQLLIVETPVYEPYL